MQRWVFNLIVVWIAEFIAIVGMSLVIPFLPLYLSEDLGVSPRAAPMWAGIIGGANFIMAALVAPIWGGLADRHGRKPMAVRALLGLAIAVGLMGYAQNAYHLLGLRLLQGALGGFVAAAIALVGSSVPRDRLGGALGTLQTAVVSGHLIGPLFGGFLSDRYGFRPTFQITGGILIVATLLVVTLVREEFTPPPTEAKPGYYQSFRLLIGIPQLRQIFVVMALTQAGIMLLNPLFSLFVKELQVAAADLGKVAGLISAAPAITSVLAAPLWGRLGDQRGHARMLALALGIAALIYPWGYVATVWWHLFCLRLALGAFTAAISPSAHAIAAHSVEEHRTAGAFSVLSSAQMLGAAVGPFVGGPLASAIGIRSLFPVTAALLLAAAVGCLMVHRAGASIAPHEPAGNAR